MDQTNIMGVHRTGHSAVPNDTVGEPSSSFRPDVGQEHTKCNSENCLNYNGIFSSLSLSPFHSRYELIFSFLRATCYLLPTCNHIAFGRRRAFNGRQLERTVWVLINPTPLMGIKKITRTEPAAATIPLAAPSSLNIIRPPVRSSSRVVLVLFRLVESTRSTG